MAKKTTNKKTDPCGYTDSRDELMNHSHHYELCSKSRNRSIARLRYRSGMSKHFTSARDVPTPQTSRLKATTLNLIKHSEKD